MRAPLKPIKVSRPWQLVDIDFMGPFKRSKRVNTHIVLAIDYFIKFAECSVTFLFNQVICRHGMIEAILSD